MKFRFLRFRPWGRFFGWAGVGSEMGTAVGLGLSMVWIFESISGMALTISLAIDLAMRDAISRLELEFLSELECRSAGFYKVE